MQAPRPKIAVLLAAYNGMLWIDEQLESIQTQIGVYPHVFISVDASTDGTDVWCEAYAEKYPNVTVLPPKEACGGAARNFFHLIRNVDFTSFDFVALADQDDRWHADKLERAASLLSGTTASAYSSNVTAFWPDGRRQLLDKAQNQVRWDHYFEAAGPGCTYVLKRHFAEHLQLKVREDWISLQDITLHDWYIYALARSHGYEWHIDKTPGLDYRQHHHNQVGANVGVSALVSRYRTIRNGWWFGQVKLIQRLVDNDRDVSARPSWRSLRGIDFLRLGLQAKHCRRRRKDQFLFGILCVFTAVVEASAKCR